MAWREPAARARQLSLCSAAVLLAIGLAANVSRGDTPSESSAVARALFDEGRTLLAEKDYDRACQKFEEAQRLDPGGGTLLNLALCNELRGKTATAWAQFDEALRWAQRDRRADREQFARDHRDAVRSRLSKLRVVVPASARTKGLTIRREGVQLGETTWDEWIPVDPGEHVIVAEAPGKIAFQRTVSVGANGARGDLVIETLQDAAPPPKSTRTPPPRASGSALQAPPDPGRDPGATQRITGLVLGGVGVVALGASAYLGLRAIDLGASSDDLCPAPDRCDPAAFDEHHRAERAAAQATGLAVTGTLVGSVGAYLFFSAPSKRRSGATLGIGPTGARVLGRF